jgi:hypothetical protein
VSVDFENQGQENMGISLEEFVASRGEFAGTPHFIDKPRTAHISIIS